MIKENSKNSNERQSLTSTISTGNDNEEERNTSEDNISDIEEESTKNPTRFSNPEIQSSERVSEPSQFASEASIISVKTTKTSNEEESAQNRTQGSLAEAQSSQGNSTVSVFSVKTTKTSNVDENKDLRLSWKTDESIRRITSLIFDDIKDCEELKNLEIKEGEKENERRGLIMEGRNFVLTRTCHRFDEELNSH